MSAPTARSIAKNMDGLVREERVMEERVLDERVLDEIERERTIPKILVADDDPCARSAVAERCKRMGFEVETAANGLQTLIRAGEWRPDILVIDVHMPEVDGLSVLSYLQGAANDALHVIVVTGSRGQDIAAKCDALAASCIRKGPDFWDEFEARLIAFYPQWAFAIRESGRSRKPALKQRPKILLVDDDICYKRMLFHKLEKLGADLLYSADGVRGFWMARREEPNVIISDYCMPCGDAEHLLTRLRSAPETLRIPVIIQTGRRLNTETRRRLRQEIGGQPGAMRILQKSADIRELIETLRRVCGFSSDPAGELALAANAQPLPGRDRCPTELECS
jgi:CheY-like chemotaxis protein